MRTTLLIDDDVLAAARELAEHQGVSIGKVISLARMKEAIADTSHGGVHDAEKRRAS